MLLGVTLTELLSMLRGEMMLSSNPGHNLNVAPAHKLMLARTQRQLHADFAWPHMRRDRDIALAENQRYYDFPTDLDGERVESVEVKYGGYWYPVTRGIGALQYNTYDSETGVKADPVLRWAPYETEQLEVWPMPAADNTQTLRLTGIRTLRALSQDSDTCDLDADLIVLSTAAEMLAEAKNPRAQVVAGRAKALYDKLRQRTEHNDSGRFPLGGSREGGRWPIGPRPVPRT